VVWCVIPEHKSYSAPREPHNHVSREGGVGVCVCGREWKGSLNINRTRLRLNLRRVYLGEVDEGTVSEHKSYSTPPDPSQQVSREGRAILCECGRG
jgi:hypothetical protein